VAGDIDGDGLLEIVFGTLDGRVHAIKGTDGSPIPNFPFQTGFRVQAQPTIAPLDPHNPNVQHILIMSFDGFLYAINGKSGCAHAVDIGENSYASVLVDDLCGDGNLELLVSTMNGNVYVLQTQARYHPLKTWTAQVGPAGMLAVCVLVLRPVDMSLVRLLLCACQCTAGSLAGQPAHAAAEGQRLRLLASDFPSFSVLCSPFVVCSGHVCLLCRVLRRVSFPTGSGCQWACSALEPPWRRCNTRIASVTGRGRAATAGQLHTANLQQVAPSSSPSRLAGNTRFLYDQQAAVVMTAASN
jgi:hypothetical protein